MKALRTVILATTSILPLVAMAGLSGCESYKPQEHSPFGQWVRFAEMEPREGQSPDISDTCAMRTIPAEHQELGAEKTWQLQCGEQALTPGRMIRRTVDWERSNEAEIEKRLAALLASGVWNRLPGGAPSCPKDKITFHVAPGENNDQVFMIICQRDSESEEKDDNKPLSGSIVSFSALHGNYAYTGHVTIDFLRKFKQKDRNSRATPSEQIVREIIVTALPAMESTERRTAVTTRAEENRETGNTSDFQDKFDKFVMRWAREIKTASDLHIAGNYQAAAMRYTVADSAYSKTQGASDEKKVEILLQLAINLSNSGRFQAAENTFSEADDIIFKSSPAKSDDEEENFVKREVNDGIGHAILAKQQHYCSIHQMNRIGSEIAENRFKARKISEIKKRFIFSENMYCDLMTNHRFTRNLSNFNFSKRIKKNNSSGYCSMIEADQPETEEDCRNFEKKFSDYGENRHDFIYLDHLEAEILYALSHLKHHQSLLSTIEKDQDEARRQRMLAKNMLKLSNLPLKANNISISIQEIDDGIKLKQFDSAVSLAGNSIENGDKIGIFRKTDAFIDNRYLDDEISQSFKKIFDDIFNMKHSKSQLVFLIAISMKDNPDAINIFKEAVYISKNIEEYRNNDNANKINIQEIIKYAYHFNRGISQNYIGVYLDSLNKSLEYQNGSERISTYDTMFKVAQLQKSAVVENCRSWSKINNEESVDKYCDYIKNSAEYIKKPLDNTQSYNIKNLESIIETCSTDKNCGIRSENFPNVEDVKKSIKNENEAVIVLTETTNQSYAFLITKNMGEWVFKYDIPSSVISDHIYKYTRLINGSMNNQVSNGYVMTMSNFTKSVNAYENSEEKDPLWIYRTIFSLPVGSPRDSKNHSMEKNSITNVLNNVVNKNNGHNKSDFRKIELISFIVDGSFTKVPFSGIMTESNHIQGERYFKWLIDDFATAYSPSVASYVEGKRRLHQQEWQSEVKQSGSRNYSAFISPVKSSKIGETFKRDRCIADSKKLQDGALYNFDSVKFEKIIEIALNNRNASSVKSSCNNENGNNISICKGEEFTRKNIYNISREMSPGGYLHLGTHGQSEKAFSCVNEPSILISDGENEKDINMIGNRDRFPFLLTETDIMGMKLNGPIVFLQACDLLNSESTSLPAANPEGIARGFLFAGARGLIASFWEAESEASINLAHDYFVQVLDESKKIPSWKALQVAQKNLKNNSAKKGPDDARSHPFYWAGLSYIGATEE